MHRFPSQTGFVVLLAGFAAVAPAAAQERPFKLSGDGAVVGLRTPSAFPDAA